MIIDVVNVIHDMAVNSEGDPPVARHVHSPCPGSVSFQFMQAPAGGGEISQSIGHVQTVQDTLNSANVRRLQPGPITSEVKVLLSLCPAMESTDRSVAERLRTLEPILVRARQRL